MSCKPQPPIPFDPVCAVRRGSLREFEENYRLCVLFQNFDDRVIQKSMTDIVQSEMSLRFETPCSPVRFSMRNSNSILNTNGVNSHGLWCNFQQWAGTSLALSHRLMREISLIFQRKWSRSLWPLSGQTSDGMRYIWISFRVELKGQNLAGIRHV